MIRISHIDDVLPHVEGRKDFVVAQKDGYTVVDYVYADGDTFDHPVRVECRGIKFGPSGHVIARPLHKFFNVGERPEITADAIDWSKPHWVTEKLDGSMIHPAIVNGQVRLMTRMGITDVARACEDQWLDRVRPLCQLLLSNRWTPIFEWCSPKNRIVVGYPRDELVVVAVRDTVTGRYMPRDQIRSAVTIGNYKWPVAKPLRLKHHDVDDPWEQLRRHTEELEGAEGYVVWFHDGQAVKVKSPWYLARHRCLDMTRSTRHLTQLVLVGGVDDVLPLLHGDDVTRVSRFNTRLSAAIVRYGGIVDEFVGSRRHLDRKEFALSVQESLDSWLHGAAFAVRDGRSTGRDAIRSAVDKAAKASIAKLDQLLEAMGVEP